MSETINVQAGDAIRVASPWDFGAGTGRWAVNVGAVGITEEMFGRGRYTERLLTRLAGERTR